MNPSMSAPTTPVSHRATEPSERYLLMIDSPWHVERSVTINDSSLSITIPAMYPATSYVALTLATTTTTQSCPLHTTYGAAQAFQPYAACANTNCFTISHSRITPTTYTYQSRVIDCTELET